MQIFLIDTNTLIPYAKNTKKHDQTQIDNVAESIRQYGFVQPIVIDKNNEVVIGHCRLLAAKQLKMEAVPCVRVDDLTDEQVKALRIVDNKSNESEWDMDFLVDELADIDLSDFDFDFEIEDEKEETEIDEYEQKKENLKNEWQAVNCQTMTKNIKNFWQSLKQRKQPMIATRLQLSMKQSLIMFRKNTDLIKRTLLDLLFRMEIIKQKNTKARMWWSIIHHFQLWRKFLNFTTITVSSSFCLLHT